MPFFLPSAGRRACPGAVCFDDSASRPTKLVQGMRTRDWRRLQLRREVRGRPALRQHQAETGVPRTARSHYHGGRAR